MKATLKSLLAALMIAMAATLTAQNRITVEATNDDISYYLDLKAVATVFADSRDLEDFEMRLNDYNSNISNLDLNGDGEIDYLRVIETYEKSTHLVVIQAVLDIDIYQDVATIVLEGKSSKKVSIRVIGDPYIYGANYVFEPVYYTVPVIYNWFWTPRRVRWISPFYWGYYPVCYHRIHPFSLNIYLTNIHRHINHHSHYRYYDSYHNSRALTLHRNVSRNDYGSRHPERDFGRRNAANTNIRNKRDIEQNNRISAGRGEYRNENGRINRENAVNGNRGNLNNGNRERVNNGNERPSRNTTGLQYNRENRHNENAPNSRTATRPETRPATTERNESMRSQTRENARPANTERSATIENRETSRPAARPAMIDKIETPRTTPRPTNIERATPRTESRPANSGSSSQSSSVSRPSSSSSSSSSESRPASAPTRTSVSSSPSSNSSSSSAPSRSSTEPSSRTSGGRR